MFLYVCKQTFQKLYGDITRESVVLRMRNFRDSILYEHKHMGRFSNLHQCTFKLKWYGIKKNQSGQILTRHSIFKWQRNFLKKSVEFELCNMKLTTLKVDPRSNQKTWFKGKHCNNWRYRVHLKRITRNCFNLVT